MATANFTTKPRMRGVFGLVGPVGLMVLMENLRRGGGYEVRFEGFLGERGWAVSEYVWRFWGVGVGRDI